MLQMTDERWNELLQRQEDLENESTGKGAERFKNNVQKAQQKGRGHTTGGARRLMLEAIEPLEAALAFKIEEKKGVRGVRHLAHKWSERVGLDIASYMTVRAVMDNIHLPSVTGTQLALRIAGYIVDELRYRRFREKCPAFFDYKLKQFRTTSYAHMSRSMASAIGEATYCTKCDALREEATKKADRIMPSECEHGEEYRTALDTSDIDMSISQRMIVGFYLLNLLQETTGIIEITQVGKRQIVVKPTAATLNWLSKRNDVLAMMMPVKMPMVVPPLPWSSEIQGGYRFALRQQNQLVRGVRTKEWARELRERSMPTVYTALNRIQETPWRINKDVLELVLAIHQRKNNALAGVPAGTFEDEPARPADIAENAEARKAYRKRKAKWSSQQYAWKLKAMEFGRVRDVAVKMQDEEAIWFPHNCDFRGRVYPVSDHLTPQGSDLQKALLTFAEGRPIGNSGIEWLAVHGANCLDKTPEGDKVSKWTRKERVKWINEHTTDICKVADDPFSATWWADAEDPLQFYAFCCEWKRLSDAGFDTEYVSSLPVGMDGSCNGLQHFAALLLDEVGGQAVNVTPNERPSDVYQAVADRVMKQLQRDAVDVKVAHMWITSGLIDRKLTKRPTMTFGYGSKQFGFSKQLMEYLVGLENYVEVRQHFCITTDEPAGATTRCYLPEATTYMAKCIWDSLGDVVIAAFGGMEWLRKCARVVSKNGKPIEWIVPGTDFKVRQEYYEVESKRVETMIAGQLVKPRYNTVTSDVEASKQSSAIAPNVIHSLDAAALMMTVEQASTDGVFAFGMIHDSYSTVPGDAALLAQITREAFFRLYTERDVPTHLWLQFQAQAGDEGEVPVPPAKGKLDLSGVLVSDYFFC